MIELVEPRGAAVSERSERTGVTAAARSADRAERGSALSERARRAVFGVLFTLAVFGAAGLMASGLVDGAGPRTVLQVAGVSTAVVFGATASVLAWRWWGGGRTDL